MNLRVLHPTVPAVRIGSWGLVKLLASSFGTHSGPGPGPVQPDSWVILPSSVQVDILQVHL